MRGTISKYLRLDSRRELAGETQAERYYAKDRNGSIIVHPNSFRALYLRLKIAYKRMRSHGGAPKLVAQRAHKRGEPLRQKEDRIAHIGRPLMFILQHCQPIEVTDPMGNKVRDALTGQVLVEPHPIYAKARRAAARGNGAEVKRIAAQFLPA